MCVCVFFFLRNFPLQTFFENLGLCGVDMMMIDESPEGL